MQHTQQMQQAMLAAAAQQNINLIVLIFAAAHAHGDTQTMQLIVNNYAQQFNTQIQQAMRHALAAHVQLQQCEDTLVQHLQQHLPMQQLKQAANNASEDTLAQAQALINKAMLH